MTILQMRTYARLRGKREAGEKLSTDELLTLEDMERDAGIDLSTELSQQMRDMAGMLTSVGQKVEGDAIPIDMPGSQE